LKYQLTNQASAMKNKLQFIAILSLPSALTAGFGTMPANLSQFAGAFAIALGFWLCMLAPVYLYDKVK
jgi:K+-transporting ATPase A subunit